MSEGTFTPPPAVPPPPPPPPTPPPAPLAFDFVRPFTFAFDDPRWPQKILVGGLMEIASILLVGIPFVLGYNAQLARNIIAGQQNPLPEWDNLGAYFSEGLRLFGVILVWWLPIVFVAMIVIVPFAIMGEMAGGEMEEAAGAVAGCLWCVIFPFSLAVMVVIPSALLRAVVEQRFGAAFELGPIWAFIKENVGNYLLAVVVYLVARFAASIGFLLLCVGVFFTAFWALLAATFAFAQVYRLGRKAA